MKKQTLQTDKEQAIALTQDVRTLWANQSPTESGASHQNNTGQASTSMSLVPSISANNRLGRRVILPDLSPDPDLDIILSCLTCRVVFDEGTRIWSLYKSSVLPQLQLSQAERKVLSAAIVKKWEEQEVTKRNQLRR
ncbi:hypothetical protein HK100_006565, partial [Physocladia obscura]